MRATASFSLVCIISWAQCGESSERILWNNFYLEFHEKSHQRHSQPASISSVIFFLLSVHESLFVLLGACQCVCVPFEEKKKSSSEILIWPFFGYQKLISCIKIEFAHIFIRGENVHVFNEICSHCAANQFADVGGPCWLWLVSRFIIVLQWPWFIVRCTKSTNQFNYRRSKW